jgi:UDP-2-acetamido-3-amino-2,3-dideoxy-glucuronate N-acetyltransferase
VTSRAALSPSDLAPNLWLGDGVRIGEGVSIGVNVVIYAGTVLGDGVCVQDGVVLGKAAVLAARSSAISRERPPLVVGDGATICTGAVVYRGAVLGAAAIVGDQAHVREGTSIGEGTVIGRGSAVGQETVVGAGVRVQTNAWLTSCMTVEDDVFVGPGVVTMNDDTMARLAAGDRLRGPVLRRACRVGGGVLITPGVEIGEEAFVAAGAVVVRDVAPRTMVRGVPARASGRVADDELLERRR